MQCVFGGILCLHLIISSLLPCGTSSSLCLGSTGFPAGPQALENRWERALVAAVLAGSRGN